MQSDVAITESLTHALTRHGVQAREVSNIGALVSPGRHPVVSNVGSCGFSCGCVLRGAELRRVMQLPANPPDHVK